MMVSETIQFNNIGVITTKLTDQQLQPIKDEINEIQNNFSNSVKYNDKLVGNIEHEYALIKTHKYIENLINPYIVEYEKKFKHLKNIKILSKDLNLGIYDVPWVNFMKKHEFNPTHNHSGVYSFVLWIDIPYDIEEEKSQKYCKDSYGSIPGHFQFIYADALGDINVYSIPADKTYNNILMIFPAKLNHAVYPFSTSDKYRISVSGNYKLIV